MGEIHRARAAPGLQSSFAQAMQRPPLPNFNFPAPSCCVRTTPQKLLIKELYHGESVHPVPPTADIQTLKGKRKFTSGQWPSLEYLSPKVENDESVKRGTRIDSATLHH